MSKTSTTVRPGAKAEGGQAGGAGDAGPGGDCKANLDTALKVLAGVQEQIRFADTKAAFVFAINTLMFGFVATGSNTLRTAFAMTPVSPAAIVGLVALIAFGVCAVAAVGTLIWAVMSRFGELAPKSRTFFGHIASQYGKDYEKYVREITGMAEADWLRDVGTQIVEASHIALAKHSGVRWAARVTVVGLVCWTVAVFSTSLLNCP